MTTSKISLNLFGEIVTVEAPQSLLELRQKISEKFLFKKSDVDELILSYTKELKAINIETEEEYKSFLDSKINKIQIDISHNNHIYQENLAKIKEEKEINEKRYNELLKQNEEYKKLLATKFIGQKQEIIDISKQIQELYAKRKKIIQTIKNEKAKIIKMKKINDKAIAELEKKIGLKSNKQNKGDNINTNTYKQKLKKNRKIKNNFWKRENSYRQKKLGLQNISIKRRNSHLPLQTPPGINKINIKRKTSPLIGNNNMMREKKIININENKISNSTNPFNEEKEELKEQKIKSIKISEIICNIIKNKSELNSEKNSCKKININQGKNIKNKEKKEISEKCQSEGNNNEGNNKKLEKTNEVLNNLINKPKKYEQLLSKSKEKNKNTNRNKNNEEKKNEKKNNKNSKINKKPETTIKNGK
jgi:hypothetical protein